MSKQQLTELLVKGDRPYRYGDEIWFKRYNDVVEVYNQSEEKKAKLQQLHCPYRSYIVVSYLLNNYLLNIAMVLCFTFLPFLNIVIQIFVISYALFLRRQIKKHHRNIQKVEDPFQNFYYYPQMCQQLQKHFTTLNLTVEQIDNFKFNETHEKLRKNLLKSQEKQNDNQQNTENKKRNFVKVPIYDQYFYDSFFLVRKEYFKAVSWSILGMVLLALSVLFYSAIYDDLTQ